MSQPEIVVGHPVHAATCFYCDCYLGIFLTEKEDNRRFACPVCYELSPPLQGWARKVDLSPQQCRDYRAGLGDHGQWFTDNAQEMRDRFYGGATEDRANPRNR